jgi:hypothetical protein
MDRKWEKHRSQNACVSCASHCLECSTFQLLAAWMLGCSEVLLTVSVSSARVARYQSDEQLREQSLVCHQSKGSRKLQMADRCWTGLTFRSTTPDPLIGDGVSIDLPYLHSYRSVIGLCARVSFPALIPALQFVRLALSSCTLPTVRLTSGRFSVKRPQFRCAYCRVRFCRSSLT